MNRRDFIAAGTSVLTVGAASHGAIAQDHDAEARLYPIGAFVLRRRDRSLQILHRDVPGRVLWESPTDGNFLIAEQANARIRSFGTPEGAYEIKDEVVATFDRLSIDTIDPTPNRAMVSGQLTGSGGEVTYQLTLEAASQTHLRFEIKVDGAIGGTINRIRLRAASSPDEAFFGFGHQLTDFNQKGNLLPILVQEHGVGRGRPIVTQLVDTFAHGGGGNPYITEAPAPHFISSKLRSLFLENEEYSLFDLRSADQIDIKVWSPVMTGRILCGETPLDLIEAYSQYCGRMRVLPDWIHNGAIISVQGGTQEVRTKLDKLRAADVPLAGLWIQDWPGTHVTSAGKQLWWNWQLDEAFYPDWRKLVSDLESHGERMLVYINPFLSNQAGHDTLFLEARQRGYLVQKVDGSPYLIKNTDFYSGLIDLSNPGARSWIKEIIKRELIGKTGASGWMADFGEALPFDSKLFGGADPATWHNRYPEEWARVNREAFEEAGRGQDIIVFHRSGFTRSPGLATSFWLGDQIQSWDEYDGIKTALVGVLSGGMSGFSLLHSDTGGFLALSLDLAGKKVPVFARTPELLMRWYELAAFTSVFRTHEGIDPAVSAQFDTSAETLAHLERFAKVYKGLASYRKGLVTEAAERGYPVVRHPFLHYPQDPNTRELRYQFLLGPDLMIAPVLDPGRERVEVYFPAGSQWQDLWTGADAGKEGHWVEMPAPMSKPAVFIRRGASSAEGIIAGLKSVGVL